MTPDDNVLVSFFLDTLFLFQIHQKNVLQSKKKVYNPIKMEKRYLLPLFFSTTEGEVCDHLAVFPTAALDEQSL